MKTLVLFLLLCPALCISQVKVEKESRIKTDEVPDKAIKFVKTVGFDKKIKWYREESADSVSIEGKTKYNKQKYSIEFDTLGTIQDIEIKIQWTDLPEAVQHSVDSCLSHNFQTYQVKKIQEQFSGSDNQMSKFTETTDGLTIKYEIVISGKSNGEIEWFECTFDQNGLWEKSRRIIFSNSDNLEY
jgi:hypothetical protein